jgi:protein-disulfide isomerase
VAISDRVGEDLTRKQRRESGRAQRKVLEEAQAAKALRRKRLTQLGIVVAIVAAGFVAAIISTNGAGYAKQVAPGSSEARTTAGTVNALLSGIPQHGNTLGQPTAPVTLQYFGDLECSVCKDFAVGALPSLIQTSVRTGKLRIEYRSLQTATREPEVFKSQQLAALAAGKQSKLWQFVETFYQEQGEEGSGYVTENHIHSIARQITGLNLSQWTNARNDTGLANQLSTDAKAVNNVGLNGTPSFLIGMTGGAMNKLDYASVTDATSFNEAIEKLAQS